MGRRSRAVIFRPTLKVRVQGADTDGMARKKKHEEHVNHERWLVSYADFITLLFAFFVVMFAVSQVDTKKMGRFTEAVQLATKVAVFESGGGLAPVVSGEGGATRSKADGLTGPRRAGAGLGAGRGKGAALGTIRKRLTESLKLAIAEKRITIVESGDGLVVRLRDAAFFDSASADVHAEVTSDLATVARTLSGVDNAVRIEGHTDSLPISNSAYRSNWELSAARASSVLSYLVDFAGIDEARLCVAGYASQRPLADNDSPQGRSQNRRVDIVVLNQIEPPISPDPVEAGDPSEEHDPPTGQERGENDAHKTLEPVPAEAHDGQESEVHPAAAQDHKE